MKKTWVAPETESLEIMQTAGPALGQETSTTKNQNGFTRTSLSLTLHYRDYEVDCAMSE